jgi:hypothetical protein
MLKLRKTLMSSQVQYPFRPWFTTNEVRVQMEPQMLIDEVKNLHKFILSQKTGSSLRAGSWARSEAIGSALRD